VNPSTAAALINQLGDAFAAGDVAAVVDRFADDGDVFYSGSEQGEISAGLPELRKLLTQLFSRNERYWWRCDSVRVAATSGGGFAILAETTLHVHRWRFGSEQASVAAGLPYRLTGLLEPSASGWRWRCCHGAEPAHQE
jgi:ketosteroid isomerase-like protein